MNFDINGKFAEYRFLLFTRAPDSEMEFLRGIFSQSCA